MPSSRRNPAVFASVLIAGVAVAILGLALQFAGDDELPADEAAATPTPTPSVTAASEEPEPPPEPEPEPEPEPVAAQLGDVLVEDLSVTGTGLYRAGSGREAAVPVDQAAVDAFRDALVAAVDAHLLDQQLGGTGTLVPAGSGGPAEPLRFVGPDQKLDAAAYTIRIGARGAPEWGRMTVDLQRFDGSAARAELVFAPGEPPLLLAARQ